MKAIVMTALMLMSVVIGIPASAEPSAADRSVETPSLQMICNGRTCCYWGNNGDYWLCSRL